ncbi:PaaX family transcriptional regulator [Amycolatopsis jejuensis]|uniref:PaaX family transcriptional regulator n=1 Tax=Amycolatopsis jejuensis TaxID=330084 RepID=UPI00052414DF|nr:PaaX family transcriptional regulator C-terminal domain-containing protein [Amycolatopsis jejuensis]
MLPNTIEASRERELRPRSLAISVFDLYAHETDDWVSIDSLLKLMSALNVEQHTTRLTVSRLKKRGLLCAERTGDTAGYRLSPLARDLLDENGRRSFGRRRADLGDGWVTVVFSVPESEREKRYTLRSRLAWLGFGTVASGVWIAPATLFDETESMLRRHDLSEYVDLFVSDYRGAQPVERSVSTWWNLPGIADGYRDFTTDTDAIRQRAKSRKTMPDAEAFAGYVQSITRWRRIPLVDPGIPRPLLEKDWHAEYAEKILAEIETRLAAPARRYAETIMQGAGHRETTSSA